MDWLNNNNINFTYRDIVKENPNSNEIALWHKTADVDIKKFFNTSGMKYKELQIKDKLPNMSEDEKIALLASDGMLVKRPLVVGDNFVLIGFKEEAWKEKLL